MSGLVVVIAGSFTMGLGWGYSGVGVGLLG